MKTATHDRRAETDVRSQPVATSPALRVMQVALSLSPGGTERLIINLTQRLRAEFDMRVCCLDEEGSWAAEVAGGGVEVIALHRRPGFHPMLARRIAQRSARDAVTVLHCHHYSPFVYGQLAAVLRPGVRVIYTEHGRLSDDPASWRQRLVNPLLGRLPATICAVSEDLKRYMAASGIPADRIRVVYNGIDLGPRPSETDRLGVRERLRIGPDAFVFGTVARLDPVKDLSTLIEAFAMVVGQLPDAHLVIVGDGPQRAALEAQVAAAPAGDRLHFLGQRDDARALLPALDVYVNTSVTEGISLTILEAMAAELPVVVTRVGGTPEIVSDGETGYLVESRAPGAVAAAVGALAADPERRRRVGAAARHRVESAFTLDRMVREYAALYRGNQESPHVWN